MPIYKIKNWNKFQHYKHRNPPWIKLHKELMEEPDWYELTGDEAKFLVEIWLIASSCIDGILPDTKKIAFRTRRNESDVIALLGNLSAFVMQGDSKMLDREEKSKEEKRRGGKLIGNAPNPISF